MSLLNWLFAPPNIAKLEASGDVEGLAAALRHKDSAVRAEAATALGLVALEAQKKARSAHQALLMPLEALMDAPAQAETKRSHTGIVGTIAAALRTAVSDVDPAVRQATVEALAPLGVSNVLAHRDGLVDALRDEQAQVRRLAAEALVVWGSERQPAVDELLAKLQDPDADVRIAAQVTLETWYTPQSTGAPDYGRVQAALQAHPAWLPATVPGSYGRERGQGRGSVSDGEVRYFAARLLTFYRRNPDGFIGPTYLTREIQEIGHDLSRRGGAELMNQVHEHFRTRYPGGANNLAYIWKGVGGWEPG